MITYLKGDATNPQSDGNKIIIHICNDINGWGAEFVLALSKKWKEPEQQYHNWFKSKSNFVLGEIQLVPVEKDIWVINMIAQEGFSSPGKPAIRYEALRNCLKKVSQESKNLSTTIHCPRIGAGLAGGRWNIIEEIINEELKNFNVFVYDL